MTYHVPALYNTWLGGGGIRLLSQNIIVPHKKKSGFR